MAYDANHKGAHNYDSAILSYKFANAKKTRREEWLATDDRAEEIENFVCGRTGFLGDMEEAINKYGAPTAGQRAAIIKCIDNEKERQKKFDAEKSKSQHIGTVGQRQQFEAEVVFVAEYETLYGFACVVGMKSGDDLIISKGTSALAWNTEKGDKVEFMAMVKEHGDRDGQKQTIVNRPTKIFINGEAQ